MPWIYLLFAGALEVVWAFTMKQSEGFSKPLESAITVITMVASFWLLSLAMRSLPLGTAYTTWTGIGTLGAFLVGVVVLAEPLNVMRLVAAGLIISGLVLMQLATP